MKHLTLIFCVTFVLLKINGNNGHSINPYGYADSYHGHGVQHNHNIYHNGVSPLFVKTFVKILKFLSSHPKLMRITHPKTIVRLLTHLSSKPALLAAVPPADLENFINLVIDTPNLINNIPKEVLISLISSATITSPGLFGDVYPYYPGDNLPTNPDLTTVIRPHIVYPPPPQTPVVPGVSVVKEVGVSVVPSSGCLPGVAAVADVAAGVSLPVAGVPQPPQTPVVPGVSVVKEVGVSVIPSSGGVPGVAAVADVAAGVSLPVAGVPQAPQTPVVPGVSVVEQVGVSVIPSSGGVPGVAAVADVAAGVSLPVAGVPQPPQTPAIPCPPQTPVVPYPPQTPGVPYPPQTPGVPYPPQTFGVLGGDYGIQKPYLSVEHGSYWTHETQGVNSDFLTNGKKLLIDSFLRSKPNGFSIKPIIPIILSPPAIKTKIEPFKSKFEKKIKEHGVLLHTKLSDLSQKIHSSLSGKNPC